MPTAPNEVDRLHDRAIALRRLAAQLESCRAIDLHRRAGDETWLGATPRRCLDDLLALHTGLRRAADDLRVRARTLDQRAAQLAEQHRAIVTTR